MNLRVMFNMASRFLFTMKLQRQLLWWPQFNLQQIMMQWNKQLLPDMNVLQISTFRRKPAKLRKHKRKQKRKKIKRMNKANRERRNY